MRAALRVLIASRDHTSTGRTTAVNALTALPRVADIGIDAHHRLTNSQIMAIAVWRTRPEELATARVEAVRLAKRVTFLDEQLKTTRSEPPPSWSTRALPASSWTNPT